MLSYLMIVVMVYFINLLFIAVALYGFCFPLFKRYYADNWIPNVNQLLAEIGCSCISTVHCILSSRK